MTSLEYVLLFFLVLTCTLFSLVYAVVDQHSRKSIIEEFGRNLKVFIGGLFLCGVFVNSLHYFFGH